MISSPSDFAYAFTQDQAIDFLRRAIEELPGPDLFPYRSSLARIATVHVLRAGRAELGVGTLGQREATDSPPNPFERSLSRQSEPVTGPEMDRLEFFWRGRNLAPR